MPANTQNEDFAFQLNSFIQKFGDKINVLENKLNSPGFSLSQIQESDLIEIANLKKDMQEAITVYKDKPKLSEEQKSKFAALQERLKVIEKDTYEQKIVIGLEKATASLTLKLSKEISAKIQTEIEKNINFYFFPNGKEENNITYKEEADFAKAINSLSTASILKVYSTLESSPDQENLKNHLNELVYKQYDSNLLAIERKDGGETHFSLKQKPLEVANRNSEATSPPEVLGIMTGKDKATLYQDRLANAPPEAKKSFYTAIFLQATYGHTFKRNNDDGKLEIKSGTLSLASMPASQVLKDEIIAQLKEFHDSNPDIKIKLDSLPEQDRAQVQAALDVGMTATDNRSVNNPPAAPAGSGLGTGTSPVAAPENPPAAPAGSGLGAGTSPVAAPENPPAAPAGSGLGAGTSPVAGPENTPTPPEYHQETANTHPFYATRKRDRDSSDASFNRDAKRQAIWPIRSI